MTKERLEEMQKLSRKLEGFNRVLAWGKTKNFTVGIGTNGYGSYFLPIPEEINKEVTEFLLKLVEDKIPELKKEFEQL